jgi:acyl-coenzyme A synthetase/AMP-(fatty) acid ligase
MHTGDMGRMDEAGYVTVVDRLKDMIISGGENVYSAEVESALSDHPDSAAVAVIGVPHERWGEAVHAVVVLRDGCDRDQAALDRHARAKLAAYKAPGVQGLRSWALRTRWLPRLQMMAYRRAKGSAPAAWDGGPGHRRKDDPPACCRVKMPASPAFLIF